MNNTFKDSYKLLVPINISLAKELYQSASEIKDYDMIDDRPTGKYGG